MVVHGYQALVYGSTRLLHLWLCVAHRSEVDGCYPSSLQPALLALVRQGLLPINAQPRVNGASSTDAAAGWVLVHRLFGQLV
jgi:N-acetyl-gamma-glutamylphosphate reductase